MALFTQYPNLLSLQGSIRCFPYLYGKIRDRNTTSVDFAKYAKRIMTILSEEGLASFQAAPSEVLSPTGAAVPCETVSVDNIVAVSIIRAGDSMLDSFLAVVPEAKVGKILIQRNEETAEPLLFYTKLPDLVGKKVFVLDPMLATGGSANVAISEVVKRGAREEDILFLNVVACPEGINAIFAAHPAIKVVTGCIDEGLNEKKYIIPGLGDFGDRFFGTA